MENSIKFKNGKTVIINHLKNKKSKQLDYSFKYDGILNIKLKEPVETIDIKHTEYGIDIKNLTDESIDNVNINVTRFDRNVKISSSHIKTLSISCSEEKYRSIQLDIKKIDTLIVSENCLVGFTGISNNIEIDVIKNYGIIRTINLCIEKLDINNSILYTKDFKKQEYIYDYFLINKKGEILFKKNKEYYDLVEGSYNYNSDRCDEDYSYNRYISRGISRIEFYNKQESSPLVEYLKHGEMVFIRYCRLQLSKRYINPIQTINEFLETIGVE